MAPQQGSWRMSEQTWYNEASLPSEGKPLSVFVSCMSLCEVQLLTQATL